MDTVVALPTLEDLNEFVRTALCEQDALDPIQTPFHRSPIVQRDKPWGMLFHVEGPRLLHTSAIWVAEADRILFYDSTGRRFREVHLSEAPSAESLRPTEKRAA